MAGARLEITLDDKAAQDSLGGILAALEDPAPLLGNIREYLIKAHQRRFREQRAPDGTPWAALSPRYSRKKKRNRNKILTRSGDLRNLLRGIIDQDSLEFGTDRPYGAIHQFGGEIKHKARTHTLYFKRNRDGTVGRRFVKKDRSDFAQDARIGDHVTRIPARPWLGTSEADNEYLLNLARRYLEDAVSAR